MVAITYRTLGAWGAGKGANLQPSEVDSNFYSLAQAIVDIQNNPEQPNGIESITVSGTQMTIYLTDGTVMGPFDLPVLTFRWRGEFDPLVPYAVLDVFTFSSFNPYYVPTADIRYGIFMHNIAMPPGNFDPDAAIDGEPVYTQLFGAVDTLLRTLGDVSITGTVVDGNAYPFDGDVLVWHEDDQLWHNETLGDMAFQFSTNVLINGGQIHNMPAPVSPGDVATKAYVDALPAGMTSPTGTMMANISGSSGPAIPNTLSAFLDAALFTTVRGTLLYRSGTGWVALAPGTAGLFLRTAGAGADPTWAVGASGVTSVSAGAGISTGGSPITATGTVALASVADNSLLANITGSSAAPSAATLTAILDHVASSTRGSILTRAGSGWVALAPGTSGYYLQTQGATADPIWSSPSGSGTVTSISAGTGISTGGAPITGAGTVSLAAIATASVLANISGSSAAPVPATVSGLFDSVFGSTQGAVLYRNATTWVMLSPGTSGQILTTGGASANPAWANAPASAPIANQRLLANISGSTAVPIANTLSDIFDSILGSSRGMLVYRGASGWAALSAGTSGQVLTTGGTAGDPHWAATAGGASITVSDTPPSSPSPGDAWFDSVGGQLYIRMDDGTSVQWVPASNQPGATGPAGSANMSGMTAGQIPLAASATTVTSSMATVPVSMGGTNSTTAAAARTALGAVNIAGDTMTGALTVSGVIRSAGSSNSLTYEDRTSSSATYSWYGNATETYLVHSSGGNLVKIDTSGNLNLVHAGSSGYKAGGGTWVDNSDIRTKENVADYTRGLEAVLQLRPVTFAKNGRGGTVRDGKTYVGLVANEAREVMPEMVGITHDKLDKDDTELSEILTLEATALIFATINCIKELQRQIDELKAAG